MKHHQDTTYREPANPLDDKPQVSVIIPVYNGERFLAEAINSVLAQDHPSFEIIIVDDGSIDGTGAIARGYRDKVRLYYQPNSGVSEARNRGINLARGEYLVFFDGDDLMYPGKLTDQAAMLDRDPFLAYVHSGWQMVDDLGKLIRTIAPWTYALHLDLETWVTISPVFLGAMMFRREWARLTGKFSQHYRQSEDLDWLLRLALTQGRGIWLKRPTVAYRQHDAGVTRRIIEAVDYQNRVWAGFFERDLPPQIRRLEDQTRFPALMWCAYRLYRAGFLAEMTPYLRQSLAFSQATPSRTVLRWLGILMVRVGPGTGPVEQLQSLWPIFQDAVQCDETAWAQIERMLDALVRTEMKKRSG